MTAPNQAEKIRPRINDLSAFKQIMESRSHPLDMLREAISNMLAPEIHATRVVIQHFSHPDYGSSFILKDDGLGMKYNGDPDKPERLDRFIGLAFSKAAGLSADYWGWKGLGSKLLLNCARLIVETWTGDSDVPSFGLTIHNPRTSLLSEPPIAPDYYLTTRPALPSDAKGTRIEVLGYDGGKKHYSIEEIARYLYLNTAVGLTREMPSLPQVSLKVNSDEKVLPIGYQFITSVRTESGEKDWRTVPVEPAIEMTDSVVVDGKPNSVTVCLKGGFTLDTGRFGLSSRRYNTGLRLSVKGIPYFQLPFYDYKGSKFQQYKDLCSFVVECDALESRLNLDRSNISNQHGDDPIVRVFRKLAAACFDAFTARPECVDFFQRQRREDEKNKASVVRQRQSKLTSPDQEYVCLSKNGANRVIHKVPDRSEHDTLALFWKLEALDMLPFAKFITWEHTKQEGIDVIASFQIDEESSLENFVPIEFEFRFENYISHGHNPKQTACIVCWTTEKSKKLRKVSDYLYWYDVEMKSIPVYEIQSFPNIAVRKYSDIQE